MTGTSWKQGRNGYLRKQSFKTKMEETREVWLRAVFRTISHKITPTEGEKYFPKFNIHSEWKTIRCWGDGSEIKNMCCSFRGPGFHSRAHTRQLLTICNSSPAERADTSDFCRHLQLHVHTLYPFPWTLTELKLIKIILKIKNTPARYKWNVICTTS